MVSRRSEEGVHRPVIDNGSKVERWLLSRSSAAEHSWTNAAFDFGAVVCGHAVGTSEEGLRLSPRLDRRILLTNRTHESSIRRK
jgi:hypothetical protein